MKSLGKWMLSGLMKNCAHPKGMARELRERFPGMRVDGVDVSEESVSAARKAAGEGGEFRVGAAEALPAGEGEYDAAFSVESVYFWPDLGKGLREMRRVVRPGGFAAAAVECADPEKARVWTELVGGGMRVRTAEELKEAFREAGFAGVEAKTAPESGLVCVVGRKEVGGGL